MYWGSFMIRVFAAAAGLSLLAGTALAADLTIPADVVPVVDNGFDWEGAYVGVEGGVNYFDSEYNYPAVGGFVGINFLVSESILLGLEASLGVITDDSDVWGELFAFGRAGVLVTPDVLLYGIGGVGYEWYIEDPDYYTEPAYQLGGGIELAVADSVTVRGQLTGYGYFNGDDLFEAARATVGVAFHF